MSIFDSITKLADRNGDGKITKDDLDTLAGKDGKTDELLQQLREQADRNEDGKIDIKDIQHLKESLTKK